MVAFVGNDPDSFDLAADLAQLHNLEALKKNILCFPTLRTSAACVGGPPHFYSITIY